MKIYVGRIAFDQLDPPRVAALNAVETSFKLLPDQVDMVIAAGHDALKNSSVFRSFVASLGGGPRPVSFPTPRPNPAPSAATRRSRARWAIGSTP